MNSRTLVVALLVAGLAAAAWLGLRGGGDAEPAPTPGPVASDAGKVPGATPAGADLAQGELERADSAAASSATDVQRTAVAGGDGKAGLSQVRVRGRLVDGGGSPRAGVKVELNTFRNPDGIEVDFPLPGFGGSPQDKMAATTRADGAFEFALATDRYGMFEVPGGELVLAAEAPRINGRKGDQDLGDLIAVGSARLGGVVQDERGNPVADVKVSAVIGSLGFGTTSMSTTDAAGRFSVGKLRPGKWTLRTASGKFLPLVEEFALRAEEQRVDLVLVVKQGQAIVGQVLDDRGLPVAGIKVGSKRKEARGGIDIERFTPDEATTTDANGFFTLAGLSGESATVRAFGTGHTSAVAADVPVGTGNLLLRVERLAAIEGVLQGIDGTPIAGSRVRAAKQREAPRAAPAANDGGPDLVIDDLPFGEGRAVATTAADGSFRIEGVRPGTVTVSAEGKTHRPVQQTGVNVVPAQDVKGLRLVADLGATARVKVVDEAGAPVAGAKVHASRPVEQPQAGGVRMSRRVEVEGEHGAVRIGGDTDALGSATSDAQGIATVTGLPAGSVQLHAEHTDYAKARPATVMLPKVGSVDASLALRRPGFAEVTVRGVDGTAADAADFVVRGPLGVEGEERSIPGTTDARGVAKVGPLAAGDYTAELRRAPTGARMGDALIMFSGDEGATISSTQRRFSVTAGETTVVDLRRPVLTKVYGTVTGVDGPVADCHIELLDEAEGQPGLPPGLMGGPTVTTGADGSFVIDDVEAGRYTLRYGKAEAIVKARADLAVQPNLPELRHDLVLRTGKVRVQAWSKGTNEAIAGAEVEVVPASSGEPATAPRREQRVMMVAISSNDGAEESTTMTMGAQRAKTGSDGWAEIDDVPAGDYTVRITHGKHVPGEKTGQSVVERQVTDIGRIDLDQAGRLRGKVLTADGKQARMALVECRAVGGTDEPERQPAMGGNFTFQGLAPGRYLVKGQELPMGPGGPGAFGPEVEVEVKAGEAATAEVRLPAK